MWRRQHVGKERKCPFSPACFEPTKPEKLTATERQRLIERIETLQRQLIIRPSERLEDLDSEIDGILMAATSGCAHLYDDGSDARDRHPSPPGAATKEHVICELCKEDWYE